MPREYAPLGQPRCAPPVFSKSGKRKREERKISFFGKHLVEKSIRTRVKSAFDKRKPSASRTVCTVTAARRKKEYLRTNRQLRAAPREQLRYVVIISIWSCQCHRVVPRSERVDLKRRSKIAKNRDEKMIRAKSNRVEFPPYEADGRFVEDDTRTTDTRAPTHASTCHVGNDALPFDPRDRNIFSPPLVFARDNATTRFDRVRFYTGQSHPLFASAAEKSIAGISRRDLFQHRHRRLHDRCQSRGIVMQSSFEDVPRRGLCARFVADGTSFHSSREEEETSCTRSTPP